jgi:hypothetical protein
MKELCTHISERKACGLTGVSRATRQRHRRPVRCGPPRLRQRPANALTELEGAEVLDVLRSPEFCDLSPTQVWATLLDRDQYLCSVSTMYRLLRDVGDHLGSEAFDMEPVNGFGDPVEVIGDGAVIASERINHYFGKCTDNAGVVGDPVGEYWPGTAFDHIDQSAGVETHNVGCELATTPQERCFIEPGRYQHDLASLDCCRRDGLGDSPHRGPRQPTFCGDRRCGTRLDLGSDPCLSFGN